MNALLPTEDMAAAHAGLTALGIEISPEALDEVIRGAAAAGPAVAGPAQPSWLSLLGPVPEDSAVAALLERLRLRMVEAYGRSVVPMAERLPMLRAQLREMGLDGFVIPHGDEYQCEFPPPGSQRLGWLTGFTGSAGAALVMTEGPAEVFVDGRYTLQVADQVDGTQWGFRHLIEEPLPGRLVTLVEGGMRIGYDPRLHGLDNRARLDAACAEQGAKAIAVADNPVDAVWQDRPPPPLSPALPHPERYTGQSSADKRAAIAKTLRNKREDAVLLTAPDSVAWLLNMRGGDVARTPLSLGRALLHADGRVDVFMDARKVAPALEEHWGADIRLRSEDALAEVVAPLGDGGKRIRVVGSDTSAADYDVLDQAGISLVRGIDPCALPRAMKNAVELDGIRAAHHRDGVALTRFLYWLERHGCDAGVTELSAAQRLEAFRREHALLRDLSFDTIAGFAANGAIVHYRVTPETDTALTAGGLFLVDSGGQYPDGTTDVTRTMAIGASQQPPTAEHRKRYTQVLKGHVALAAAVFPQGTTGTQLDTLARAPLWADGVDYDHGTGHGVGCYLGVHEGPQRIAKAIVSPALLPGMILSDEPGYYKTGAFGIRIENLVAVVPVEKEGAERPLLGFETLTLAPYDRALIDADLLSAQERAWVDGYHARVHAALSPDLDAETAAWLAEATRPL